MKKIIIPCLLLLVSCLFVGCASHQHMGKLPHERGGPGVTVEVHDRGMRGGSKVAIIPSLSGHSPAYNKAYRRVKSTERRNQHFDAQDEQLDSCYQDAIERRPMNVWDYRFYNKCLDIYERTIISEQEREYSDWERREYRKGQLDARRDINGYFEE